MIDDKIIQDKINRINAAFKVAFNYSSDRIVIALSKEEEEVAQDMTTRIQEYYNKHKNEIADPNTAPTVYSKFLEWLKSVKTTLTPGSSSGAAPAVTASVKKAFNNNAIIEKVKSDLQAKDKAAYDFFFKAKGSSEPAPSNQLENAADPSKLNVQDMNLDLNQTENKNPADTSQNPFGGESFAEDFNNTRIFSSEIDGQIYAHALDPARQHIDASSKEVKALVDKFVNDTINRISEVFYKASQNPDYWNRLTKNPSDAGDSLVDSLGNARLKTLDLLTDKLIANVKKYSGILSKITTDKSKINTTVSAYIKTLFDIIQNGLNQFVNGPYSVETKLGHQVPQLHALVDAFKDSLYQKILNSFKSKIGSGKSADISNELVKSIYAEFENKFTTVVKNLDQSYDLDVIVKAITGSNNARYNALLARHIIACYSPEGSEMEMGATEPSMQSMETEEDSLVNSDLIEGYLQEEVDETNVKEKVEELTYENELMKQIIDNKYLTEEYLRVMDEGMNSHIKVITGDEEVAQQVSQAGIELLTKLFSGVSKEELNELVSDLPSVQTICQYLNAEIQKIDTRFSMKELSVDPLTEEIKVVWDKRQKFSGDIINNYYTGEPPKGDENSSEEPLEGEGTEEVPESTGPSPEAPAEPTASESQDSGPEQLEFPASSGDKTEAEEVFTS